MLKRPLIGAGTSEEFLWRVECSERPVPIWYGPERIFSFLIRSAHRSSQTLYSEVFFPTAGAPQSGQTEAALAPICLPLILYKNI